MVWNMFVRSFVRSLSSNPASPPVGRAELVVVVAAVVALAAVATGRSGAAHANSFAPEAFDTTILGTDAVVVATVDGIKLDPESGVAELQLRDLDVITTRIDLGGELRSLHVAAHGHSEPDTSERVRPSPMDAPIEDGYRYFFFLRGGAWNDWPVVPRMAPLEVRDDVVLCQGGEVYGIDPMGVLCGIASDYASAPLTESAFERQLASALNGARARRPAAAAVADSAARPLDQGPTARGAGVTP